MVAPLVDSTPAFVEEAYRKMEQRLRSVRDRLGRPLTYAEKVLLGHLDDPGDADLLPGESYLNLRPDRVGLQDVTGQMAILQFMQAGKPTTAVPTTVHCDHLITAFEGALADTNLAKSESREVFDFLRSSASKYGLGFWGPGSGIIHQVILENYAFPGLMIIGTDSHTPNAGGLGAFASGVGGADAVDVMAGFPWEVLYPRLIGVKLTGSMSGWTAPKDVILKLAGILTVSGGTNAVVEYFGPGVNSISATGKATICNMGAELGATTSIFPYDGHAAAYLRATGRPELAELADKYAHLLTGDAEVEANPGKYFDRVIEIDLDTLEPHVVGPHTPDLARPISELAEAVIKENYPDRLSATLIGSCTNSSYEDVSRAANVARQAAEHGVGAAVDFLVTPGSEAVNATIQRDGQMAALESVGASVMANACGPCIGQWKRPTINPGDVNSIVTSFNRNFPARNDANPLHDELHREPGDRDRVRPGGPPLLQPHDRHPHRRRRPALQARPARRGAGGAGGRLRGARLRLRASRRRRQRHRRERRPDLDAPAGALAVPALGRRRLRARAGAREGEGQVHDRPHLPRRAVAALPGPPGAAERQRLPRRGQRLHRRARRGAEPGHRASAPRSRRSRATTRTTASRGSPSATSTTERAAPASTPRCRRACWAARPSSCAASPASTRRTSRSRASCPSPSPTRTTTTRSSRPTPSASPAWTTSPPASPSAPSIHHFEGGDEEIDLTHTMSEEQLEWFRAGAALNILGK